MKYKIFIISFIAVVLIIIVIFTGFISSNAFLKSQDYMSLYEFNKVYYLGYRIGWEGFSNPEVKNVYLLDSNKNIIKNQKSNSYKLDFFVDESKHIGSTSKKDDQENFQFADIQNYKVKNKDMNIIIKVKVSDDYLKNVRYLEIDYSVFGLMKKQIFKIYLTTNS